MIKVATDIQNATRVPNETARRQTSRRFGGERWIYYKQTDGPTPTWALPDKIITSKLDAFSDQDEYRFYLLPY